MGGIVSKDAGENAARLLAECLRNVGQSLSTAAQHLADGMRGAGERAALYLSIAIVVVAAIIAYTAHSIISMIMNMKVTPSIAFFECLEKGFRRGTALEDLAYGLEDAAF